MNARQGHAASERPRKRKIGEVLQQARNHQQRAFEAIQRGHRDVASRDLDRAIADYSEVIRIDPTHAEAYLLRARLYEQKGEDDKAELDLAKVRELEGS